MTTVVVQATSSQSGVCSMLPGSPRKILQNKNLSYVEESTTDQYQSSDIVLITPTCITLDQ